VSRSPHGGLLALKSVSRVDKNNIIINSLTSTLLFVGEHRRSLRADVFSFVPVRILFLVC